MNQSRMGLARQFCWMMAPVLLLSGMAFANAPARAGRNRRRRRLRNFPSPPKARR
ncbi:hypothetical protein [Humisphaera borealis]|uniref:Uncharacterized protein n=1 Tax=Humisphaera borealis TaxID=2807512 RepID=A0A7M2WW87_9BACT|nr:hypothetical protein [Humisphaera borealis]QOV89111.1 hypothetical protein IPV69_23290 [Humisphaera borealis]